MRATLKSGKWLAITLALGLFTGGALMPQLTPVTPAHAEADENTEHEEAPVELIVAPNDAVIDPAATTADFQVLLRNTGERSLPEGSIELSIGAAIAGASAVIDIDAAMHPVADSTPQESDDDTTAPRPRAVVALATVGATAVEAEQTLNFTVPAEDLPFIADDARGVYPIFATYRASNTVDETVITAYSPIAWDGLEPATQRVNLTLIVPLVLPTEISTMPSRSQLATLASQFDALLTYAMSTHATLAIDPRLIVAIRAYGSEAPQSAQDLLARLEQTALSSFLLQYADADPAAQASLNAHELLQPAGFDFITRHGAWPVPEPAADPESEADSEAESTPPEDTDAGADTDINSNAAASQTDSSEADSTATDPLIDTLIDTPGTPPIDPGTPTLEELSAWQNGIAAAWPAPGQANPGTLNLLRSSGLSTTVLRSDNVSLAGGSRATLGEGEAIITDAELDAAVRSQFSGTSKIERDLGSAQATARLILAANAGVHGLVLGVDRGSIANAESPVPVLTSTTAHPWVRTVDLEIQEQGSAQIRTLQPENERVDLLAAAQEHESYVLEARNLLVNPEYLDEYQRLRLLSLFGTRHAQPDVDFAAAAKRFTTRDDELHDGVSIVGTKHAQLVGSSTRIPVQLRNTLPFDASITLAVSPTSAVLSVPDRQFTEVLLPRDSTERVLVPVHTRVSSGASGLVLTVTDAAGEFTASTDFIPVSVSTNIETIGLSVLAAAAVLLFGFGIWRSLRKRRSFSVRE